MQGEDNWYYGYFDGAPLSASSFQQMQQFDLVEDAWKVDFMLPSPKYWTMVDRLGGHPNGFTTSGGRTPDLHWAVRRYVSEVAGMVTLSGTIGDRNPFPGTSGIIGRIFVDGSQVFTQTILDGGSNVDYSIDAVVEIGSTIDFAIDPRGTDWADLTLFTSVVSTVPEPSTSVGVASIATVPLIGRYHRRTKR